MFCFIVVAVLVWLGFWQWGVAGGPHPAGASIAVWRNYAYAVNWWIFAAVAVWFWWRFMRDQKSWTRSVKPNGWQSRRPRPLAVEGRSRSRPIRRTGNVGRVAGALLRYRIMALHRRRDAVDPRGRDVLQVRLGQ